MRHRNRFYSRLFWAVTIGSIIAVILTRLAGASTGDCAELSYALDFSASQTDGEWLLPTMRLTTAGGSATLTYEIVGERGWTWITTANTLTNPDCEAEHEATVKLALALANGQPAPVVSEEMEYFTRWLNAVNEFVNLSLKSFLPVIVNP